MIKITDKYYIRPEDMNYTVCTRKLNEKTGKYSYRALTYHATYVQAVEKIMRMVQADKLSQCDIGFQESVRILKNVNDEFKRNMETYLKAYERLQ